MRFRPSIYLRNGHVVRAGSQPDVALLDPCPFVDPALLKQQAIRVDVQADASCALSAATVQTSGVAGGSKSPAVGRAGVASQGKAGSRLIDTSASASSSLAGDGLSASSAGTLATAAQYAALFDERCCTGGTIYLQGASPSPGPSSASLFSAAGGGAAVQGYPQFYTPYSQQAQAHQPAPAPPAAPSGPAHWQANELSAVAALAAIPGGMQVGGAMPVDVAVSYLAAGAARIVPPLSAFVASSPACGEIVDHRALRPYSATLGRAKLVLDVPVFRVPVHKTTGIHRSDTSLALATSSLPLSSLGYSQYMALTATADSNAPFWW